MDEFDKEKLKTLLFNRFVLQDRYRQALAEVNMEEQNRLYKEIDDLNRIISTYETHPE